MTRQEISYLVAEKVFHQCRHTWVSDKSHAKTGFYNIQVCTGCKRSSLTVDFAGLPVVGNGTPRYTDSVETATVALQKMAENYSCSAKLYIRPNGLPSCTIKSTQGEDKIATVIHKSMAIAITLTMLKYVTGETYEVA